MGERIILEIDAPLYAGDDTSLTDAIVAEAGRQIANRAASGRDLYDDARRLGGELLREALEPRIKEALSAVLQPTDNFGTPKGQPQTWGDVIQKEIEKQLKLPSGARYSGDRSTLEKLIGEEVERQLRSELSKTLETARKQVLAAVEAEGAKLIREAVRKAVA